MPGGLSNRFTNVIVSVSEMRVTIPIDEAAAEVHLSDERPDGSGVGVNYVDHIAKAFKLTLADGKKLLLKRRGLKLTLALGERQGEALLRRIDHGPDEKSIFRQALAEAARGAGAAVSFEAGCIHLDVGS